MKFQTLYFQPIKNDAKGWCRFCFGPLKKIIENESGDVEMLSDKETTDHKEDTESKEQSTDKPSSIAPLLSIVLYMNQVRYFILFLKIMTML